MFHHGAQDERCSKLKIYPILQKVRLRAAQRGTRRKAKITKMAEMAETAEISGMVRKGRSLREDKAQIGSGWFWGCQVYLERILRQPEVDAFARDLKDHQVRTPIHLPPQGGHS